LQPDLPFDAVIPEAVVGRTRYHRLHRFRRQDVSYAFGLVAVENGHLRPLLQDANRRRLGLRSAVAQLNLAGDATNNDNTIQHCHRSPYKSRPAWARSRCVVRASATPCRIAAIHSPLSSTTPVESSALRTTMRLYVLFGS